MEPRITREVLEGYLNCRVKGQLKLKGARGTTSDYEALMTAARVEHAKEASQRLGSRQRDEEVQRNIEVTVASLRRGSQLVLDAAVNGETLSIRFDGLKRVDGPWTRSSGATSHD